MSKMVLTNPALASALTNLISPASGNTGVLNGTTAALVTALNGSPTNNSVWTDVTEPTNAQLPGYSGKSVTWQHLNQDVNGSAVDCTQLLQWIPSTTPESFNIVGLAYAVNYGVPSLIELVALEQFDNPVVVTPVSDIVTLVGQIKLDASGNFGSTVIIDG